LILKTWKDPMFIREENNQLLLLWKLQVAKKVTKSWLKENKKKSLKLQLLEVEIKHFSGLLLVDPNSLEFFAALK